MQTQWPKYRGISPKSQPILQIPLPLPAPKRQSGPPLGAARSLRLTAYRKLQNLYIITAASARVVLPLGSSTPLPLPSMILDPTAQVTAVLA